MPFVLDASVAAAWALKEKPQPAIVGALDRLAVEWAVVPALWWYEVRNVLMVSERRGRFPQTEMGPLLAQLGSLDLNVDYSWNESAVVELARRHRLTFYDATYLELAMRERCPLATLDLELVHAAEAEGTVLIGGGTA